MKKIIAGLAILSTLVACQDELYDNDLKEHKANQAVYIDGGTSLTVNLAENTEYIVKNFSVKLVSPSTGGESATLEVGNEAQLKA